MSIIFSKYSNSKKEIASELSLIFMYLVIFCFVASGNAFGNSYVVDSLEDTDDNGAYIEDNSTNTLRKCIRLANDNAGSDTITFNISGIINAVSPPLEITDSGTIIDASSQWSGIWPNGTPGVTLNGNINMVTNGFVIQSACDCAISGLFITYFRDSGISIVDGSQNNIIGGASTGSRNVISGNNFGVFIAGINTNNNHVKGNYIGTNATGTSALGNADTGVCIDGGAQGNVIV